MKLEIRRREHGGRSWWHWQLTHDVFGRCGNGWAAGRAEAFGDGATAGWRRIARLGGSTELAVTADRA